MHTKMIFISNISEEKPTDSEWLDDDDQYDMSNITCLVIILMANLEPCMYDKWWVL